ncbi:MAG: LuxR C-terminal-related transcriptional regulator [Dehalococcoidia bacterium]
MASETEQFRAARSLESQLNDRQLQVLDLLVAGKTNGEIGDELGITLDGAKWNVSEIMGKLGLDSREQAADYWRWRKRSRIPAPNLRGLATMGALKWAGGTAAVLVVGIVLLAVLYRDDDSQVGDLPPFYLEARIESLDRSTSVGTNLANADLEPVRRVMVVRWWNRDMDHMRVEIETLEPASDAGTDLIVTNGTEQIYYRESTNSYSRTPLYDFPEEAKLRVRPWSFSTFIGPWPSAVANLDELIGQLKASGGNDHQATVTRVGTDVVLGRPTTIIELAPVSASSTSDGVTTYGRSARYWVDEERMVFLREEVDSGGAGNFDIAVTRLDWDTKISATKFDFDPPKDARRELDNSPSQLADQPGDSTSMGSSGVPEKFDVDTPPGMLELPAVPQGFESVEYEITKDSGNEAVTFRLSYAGPGSRALEILQRVRPGGLQQWMTAGMSPVDISGTSGYLSEDGETTVLTWSQGDLVVRITAVGMDLDEVKGIAESLRITP